MNTGGQAQHPTPPQSWWRMPLALLCTTLVVGLDIAVLLALSRFGPLTATLSGVVHAGGTQLAFTAVGVVASFGLILGFEMTALDYFWRRL
jgi:hypothetical protein